ncbi:non-structural maintenance of chromosomes element 1 homolog isoform X1 [Aplysia californica]|uniref:Non-structural maintenance of chromosomes element 1 homolog n=1 Tax=Aplysia californica TaxID=6500 RepID=A0ABM0JSH3_APLCA|nr:non-structural maintenance of chromosomes element 1 homolog isoform X1 [Aplysia californica]
MMNDGHRFTLQHFMSKGILNAKEVKTIFSQSKDRFQGQDEEDLRTFILTINQSVAPFNLEIKKGIQEDDGQSHYCLVNTVETPISRLSSTYTLNELELFKKLVEQIVNTEDGKVGSLAAVNLTERLEKKMGKEDAEIFFEKLERDKWIKKDKNGKISLSVRSLLELEQYLKEVYADYVKSCGICDKICLLGETCSSCGVKLHLQCAKNLFSRQGDDRKCPSYDCRAPWGEVVL